MSEISLVAFREHTNVVGRQSRGVGISECFGKDILKWTTHLLKSILEKNSLITRCLAQSISIAINCNFCNRNYRFLQNTRFQYVLIRVRNYNTIGCIATKTYDSGGLQYYRKMSSASCLTQKYIFKSSINFGGQGTPEGQEHTYMKYICLKPVCPKRVIRFRKNLDFWPLSSLEGLSRTRPSGFGARRCDS